MEVYNFKSNLYNAQDEVRSGIGELNEQNPNAKTELDELFNPTTEKDE